MNASQKRIRAKVEKIKQRLKEIEGKKKVIEAELLAVRHACPHESVEEWNHYDYGGGCDRHWLCNDCGLQKVI